MSDLLGLGFGKGPGLETGYGKASPYGKGYGKGFEKGTPYGKGYGKGTWAKTPGGGFAKQYPPGQVGIPYGYYPGYGKVY